MSDDSQKPNIITNPDQFTAEERRRHLEKRLEVDPSMTRLIERLGELPVRAETSDPLNQNTDQAA